MWNRSKHLLKLLLPAQGFTLIEVLVALALILTFTVGILSLYRLGLLSGTKATYALQARILAQEGMEAITVLRDTGGVSWDWSSTPSNTGASEYYQPSLTGSSWNLGSKMSTSPAPVLPTPNQKYTRTVKIDQVQRAVGCGSAICSIVTSGGVVDTGTRKITVTVEWSEEDGQKQIVIESYLTRWR